MHITKERNNFSKKKRFKSNSVGCNLNNFEKVNFGAHLFMFYVPKYHSYQYGFIFQLYCN